MQNIREKMTRVDVENLVHNMRANMYRLSRSQHNAKTRKYRFRRWAITTVRPTQHSLTFGQHDTHLHSNITLTYICSTSVSMMHQPNPHDTPFFSNVVLCHNIHNYIHINKTFVLPVLATPMAYHLNTYK